MKEKNLNILIVEDESLLGLEFSSYIKANGYRVVDCVTNSKDALRVMSQKSVNLIIMDINIGEEMDGIDLYKSFNTDAYVVYLTAYKDDETIAKAIDTEPLGYLTKPMNDGEFRAVLQLAEKKVTDTKQKNNNHRTFELSQNYTFDLDSDILYQRGKFVRLSGKKRQLLKLLIKAEGNPVSFEEIEDELYKDTPPSESALRTLIYRLRNDLDEDLIVNELNFGIRLKKDSSPDTCGT